MNKTLIKKAVLVSVVINLFLPALASRFATKDQIKPPNGATNLPPFDQIMHMFVHHAQVPITSSFIVATIVALSIFIADSKKII